jgi:hypothetical protein
VAVTLASMREQARQRADMVNSEFCSDAEINQYINNSAAELYDLLVSVNEDYFVSSTPQSISVTSGTDSYDLAADFYKALGVDLYLNGSWVTMKPFMFAERNAYQGMMFDMPFRYRIRGGKISFVPVPSGNHTVQIWYIPRFTALASDAATFDGINGWEEYVIVDAAIKMLQKEESDVSVLLAQKEALKARINTMAANRDSGSPQRIVDVEELESDPFFRRLP